MLASLCQLADVVLDIWTQDRLWTRETAVLCSAFLGQELLFVKDTGLLGRALSFVVEQSMAEEALPVSGFGSQPALHLVDTVWSLKKAERQK